MKTIEERLRVSPLTLAVRAALMTLSLAPTAAFAADENADVTALTRPLNFVEIGVENVSEKSAKFGEYNGLNDSGPYGIGNFSLRGGDAYDSYNGGKGVTRWELKGIDLGTTSREAGGSISSQGRWSLGIGYDELRHYSTDTYQMPFQGSMGGNSFILPPAFGVIDVNAADIGSQGMTASQKAFFHAQDVYSGRRNESFSAGYIFDPQWSAQFDYNRLDQSGAKLIGASFDATGGGAGETIGTLMNPTNYKTDSFNLALNWVGDQGHVSATYFASLFSDGNTSLSFSNPFFDGGGGTTGTPPAGGAFPLDVMATAPDNRFQQIDLSGGYDFGSNTKLAGGFSYGRNTQDASFFADPLLTSPLPAGSLHGLVVSTHADLKLTHQATGKLSLSANVKYDERDNRTPSYTFGSFQSIAGDTWGPTVSAPMSYRKTQIELAGNYRLDKRQSLQLAYGHEIVDRWCNNALANSAQSSDPTAPAGYYTDQSCAQVPKSNEDKLSARYRFKARHDLTFDAGYTYAKRRADVNGSFYNPMQTSAEGFENLGFLAFFQASRTENLVKAGINWQAAERLNIGLNGRYTDDQYGAALGVQQGHVWRLNLDAAYSYSEEGSASAYLSIQQRNRDLLSSADKSPLAPSINLWTNRLADYNTTVGLTARQKGLMHRKLELAGDLSYSLGRTSYSTQTPNCTDATLCQDPATNSGTLPDIKNQMLRLRLGGTYEVDQASAVSLGYTYQKLNSNDYYFSAYQTGFTDATVLPTNQQAPNYAVNLVMVSYRYRFH